jgi:predicted alpha/beta hydrolase family esterase
MSDSDVLTPSMPNKDNAQFDEWKIYFEKILPFLSGEVQIVGNSLGAMFLAKYLQENPLERPVKRIVLVAPGYDDDSNEDLGSFGVTSATRLGESAAEVHLFHSQDDPVVPYAESAKYLADVPDLVFHNFTSYGHFLEPTFPELLELLQQK